MSIISLFFLFNICAYMYTLKILLIKNVNKKAFYYYMHMYIYVRNDKLYAL